MLASRSTLLVAVLALAVSVSALRLDAVPQGAALASSFVETGAMTTAEMAQVAEDKSTTDELLDSILPAEAASLAQTQTKMMQQMRETQARLAELNNESPYERSLAAQFAHFKAKRARIMAEIEATTQQVNALARRNRRAKYASSDDSDSSMLELSNHAEPVDSTADSDAAPQQLPNIDLSSAMNAKPSASPLVVERAHYLFPMGQTGTLDCMCALMPGPYDEKVHSVLHQVEDRQNAAKCGHAPMNPPTATDDDIWTPVPDGNGHIKPVACFDACQKHKCKPVFKSSGFDAYHECLMSCVHRCYKGNPIAMKVAEDAVQVQAEVNAKVKAAMKERLFDSESYAAKHLH